MTYYDHATAMAFKLDRWSDERILRNYEREALACEELTSANSAKKRSLFRRCISVFHSVERKKSAKASIPSKT